MRPREGRNLYLRNTILAVTQIQGNFFIGVLENKIEVKEQLSGKNLIKKKAACVAVKKLDIAYLLI